MKVTLLKDEKRKRRENDGQCMEPARFSTNYDIHFIPRGEARSYSE